MGVWGRGGDGGVAGVADVADVGVWRVWRVWGCGGVWVWVRRDPPQRGGTTKPGVSRTAHAVGVTPGL